MSQRNLCNVQCDKPPDINPVVFHKLCTKNAALNITTFYYKNVICFYIKTDLMVTGRGSNMQKFEIKKQIMLL
jgi:hypothetical protein